MLPNDLEARYLADVLPLESMLLKEALKLTKKQQDAEDLTQDTLLRAYRYFDQFEAGTNLHGWLITILRNTFYNNYNKAKRTPVSYLDEIEDWQDQPEKAISAEEVVLDRIETDSALLRNLNSLPLTYREPLALFALHGFSYKEIALMLCIPAGTVMSRIHRARKRMKVLHQEV